MTRVVPTGYERREVVGCGYHWLAAASRSVEGGGAQGSLIGLDSRGIHQEIGEDGIMGSDRQNSLFSVGQDEAGRGKKNILLRSRARAKICGVGQGKKSC